MRLSEPMREAQDYDPDFWVPCLECGNPPWECQCGGTRQPLPSPPETENNG